MLPGWGSAATSNEHRQAHGICVLDMLPFAAENRGMGAAIVAAVYGWPYIRQKRSDNAGMNNPFSHHWHDGDAPCLL